jgi:hypothetical protein
VLNEYKELRILAGKRDVNKVMLERAEKAMILAHVTEFEGRCIKLAALANGLAQKKQFQKAVRDFGDTGVSPDAMLPQVWASAVEFSGVPAPGGGSAAASSSSSAAIVTVSS